MTIKPSLQDFSLIESFVKKSVENYGLKEKSNGFMFFVLGLLLKIQEDEILESITDSSFLNIIGKNSGHDRGIDAIYIDENTTPAIVHFFNFKYTENFDKTINHFPSTEIDKITSFLNSLMSKDKNLKNDINKVLYSKVEEIWELFEEHYPYFHFHICGNSYLGFEKSEKNRFEREIHKHSEFEVHYNLMVDLVNRITRRNKIKVNCRIRAIDKNFFEKSEGDIRALIVNFDVVDLVRIVLNDDEIREEPYVDDIKKLKNFQILGDAFEDNVRVYLKQRTKINRSIKETVLSEENYRFFYYNNGITMTCDKFEYPQTQRAPIITIANLQVVNGGQTIHALYDALLEDPSKLQDIDILCRLYETKNKQLSTNIAEYTNSQNPVKNRDIRSVDYTQKKLEQEFLAKELYYERKKNQYEDKPKKDRIDAEKAGQVLLAFYNKMPAEAKNRKSIIFGDKYEEVFNEGITVDKILLPYTLWQRIENIKIEEKPEIISDPEKFEKKSYLLYSSYYILYILNEITDYLEIDIDIDNLDKIWDKYPNAIAVIEELIKKEKQIEGIDTYSNAVFFKTNNPKRHLKELMDSSKIGKFI